MAETEHPATAPNAENAENAENAVIVEDLQRRLRGDGPKEKPSSLPQPATRSEPVPADERRQTPSIEVPPEALALADRILGFDNKPHGDSPALNAPDPAEPGEPGEPGELMIEVRGIRTPIAVSGTTIGRSRQTDVRNNDERISRLHLRLHIEGAHLFGEDLGSSNGTVLLRAGERIPLQPSNPIVLEAGDDLVTIDDHPVVAIRADNEETR